MVSRLKQKLINDIYAQIKRSVKFSHKNGTRDVDVDVDVGIPGKRIS